MRRVRRVQRPPEGGRDYCAGWGIWRGRGFRNGPGHGHGLGHGHVDGRGVEVGRSGRVYFPGERGLWRGDYCVFGGCLLVR